MRLRLLSVWGVVFALVWALSRPTGQQVETPTANPPPQNFRGRPAEHWRLALRAGCFDTGFGGVGIVLADGDETISLRPSDEVPGLVSLLLAWSSDHDPFVRKWALQWLSQWTGPREIGVFFRALDDSDFSVRWTAAREIRGWHASGRGPKPPRWADRLVDQEPPVDWHARHARLSRSEVKKLRGWRGVRAVFAGPGVANAELDELATLPDLEWLNMDGTRVSDGGLRAIAGMLNLKVIELRGAGVSAKGVAQLRADRPDLSVRW